MEIADAELHLLERLSGARETARSFLSVLDLSPPVSIAALAGIGIDTNILKKLRREPTFADGLFVSLRANSVALIAPGQCIVEFWNNHRVFANDDWNGFRNDLGKLAKRIESESVGGQEARMISEIGKLVEELSGDLQESKSPDYLTRSQELIRSLLEIGSAPMVSRPLFADLARIRSAIKAPPGFADEKLKSASLGDFYVWCDFLLGALCVDPSGGGRKFAWVTDDAKPDWKTGDRGHPSLVEEFHWVTGAELSVLSLDNLRSLAEAEAASNTITMEVDPDDR